MDALTGLRERLAEIDDLERVGAVLQWDLNVTMPPGGEPSRTKQFATLEAVIHERRIDDRIGELVDELADYASSLPPDADDACLVRVAKRGWERSRRVPTTLAAQLAEAEAEAFSTWVRAREASDFAMFRPSLERMLELKLQWLECYAPYADPYDVFLEDFEEGLTSTEVTRIFDVLRPRLSSLTADHANEQLDADFLTGPFPIPIQDELSRTIVERFGASWDAFRLDVVPHPFATKIGPDDVRLTTTYDETTINALFSAMHECGHGLYEWGSARSLDRTPLTGCTSATLHESQSRLWENAVGRSLSFWRWFYPQLQEAFPGPFAGVSLERFHEAINRVQQTLVRIDADETTYGLHIILRTELERELVAGRLAVADLPDAWNARFEELLGIAVPDDRRGVLQDTHWAVGLFGYFPTYLLGSVLSIQIWERARADLPELDAQIEHGDFRELHGWLREHLYVLGSKLTPAETIARVVGGPIDPEPYLAYLRAKR